MIPLAFKNQTELKIQCYCCCLALNRCCLFLNRQVEQQNFQIQLKLSVDQVKWTSTEKCHYMALHWSNRNIYSESGHSKKATYYLKH